MLKVLFISRATLYTDRGGDTIQVINTAEHLRKTGVSVTIKLCNERIDYAEYDLVHFFNIIRPADILQHSIRSHKPYLVSTIYVDYSEFEKRNRRGAAGFFFRIFPADSIEYIKVIARWLINGERIISPSWFWLGQQKSIRAIIRRSAMLLPNSHSEYRRLANHFNISHDYQAIPNAIDPVLFAQETFPLSDRRTHCLENPDLLSNAARDPWLVLCVGRIEGRKNQLTLIHALKGTPFRLVIIGPASVNQAAYFAACRQAADENISFVENVPQQELISYYRRAKVHVLPSWFETTGLSSLEAAAMGCNIVITDKGDTREYFGEDAWYCDPASAASVREAIGKAAAAGPTLSLQARIFKEYTWEKTANETLQAYKTVLGKLKQNKDFIN